jgi:hypothetical protein
VQAVLHGKGLAVTAQGEEPEEASRRERRGRFAMEALDARIGEDARLAPALPALAVQPNEIRESRFDGLTRGACERRRALP